MSHRRCPAFEGIRGWMIAIVATLWIAPPTIGRTAWHSSMAAAQDVVPAADCVLVPLDPSMLSVSAAIEDVGLSDEPKLVGRSLQHADAAGWKVRDGQWDHAFPATVTIELPDETPVARLWIYDLHGQDRVTIAVDDAGTWREVARYGCEAFAQWHAIQIDQRAKRIQLTLSGAGSGIGELGIEAYTPTGWQTAQDAREAATLAAAEKERFQAAHAAMMARRPIEDHPRLGKVRLVQSIDLASTDTLSMFRQFPDGATRIERMRDTQCRVIDGDAKLGSYFAVRVGRWMGLHPGAMYGLEIDYDDSASTSFFVLNHGNETALGIATGNSVGDALLPKYVRNNAESLSYPNANAMQTWTHFFVLHDATPSLGFPRGQGPRPVPAEEGFDVVIGRFSSQQEPMAGPVAIAAIRLWQVIAPIAAKTDSLPDSLPKRRLFWREEMADGVMESPSEVERGVKDRLDWYRAKVAQMRFLGFNTYARDLLEFGHCQHWDPTPEGGQSFYTSSSAHEGLWEQIVALMGQEGFDVLPYFEYAGSRGSEGLGIERRAKPLLRDDAYTHIGWAEDANVDITDPVTIEDFERLLKCTVYPFRKQCRFAGVWLRPRWQMPMSFSDATRARFAKETNRTTPSKQQLQQDAKLLAQYEAWWFAKRRDFMEAIADRLQQSGIDHPLVLLTPDASEPGPNFPMFEPTVVTDDVARWRKEWEKLQHLVDAPQRQQPLQVLSRDQVLQEHRYGEAVRTAPLNWGQWDVSHGNPAADPENYSQAMHAQLTLSIHRAYSADDPSLFDAFRTPSGLAVVHHYPLNEHMMFDEQDKPTLQYFICDFERAGAACIYPEVLAMANGDPTSIGDLHGGNMGRGFPDIVRRFNENFLALPALPSKVVPDACGAPEVVVRAIDTGKEGVFAAIIHTGWQSKPSVEINVDLIASSLGLAPSVNDVRDAVTGQRHPVQGRSITIDLPAISLTSIRIR
jgi:hypothetical protein